MQCQWTFLRDRLPDLKLEKVLLWRPEMERAVIADVDVLCAAVNHNSDNAKNYQWTPLPDPSQEKPRPKVVCLCGSTRFMDAFQKANLRETIEGNIVLSVGCNTKSDLDLMTLGKMTQRTKDKLDVLHLRKIDLADEILVLNVDGYVGESTSNEVRYAQEHGKGIRWLEPEKIPSHLK